jgi:DNA-binding NarL/FixJ family response regulator
VDGYPVAIVALPRRTLRRLPKRQTEVMSLLSRGYENETIARELGIGVETVKTHLRRVRETWGVRSRAVLILYAALLYS